MRALPLRLLAAALLLAFCGGCKEDSARQDTRDIEKAYYALRDALLQGDDEAFFALHGSEARRWALDSFPAIRAGFVAGTPAERRAFQQLYRVTEEEFLGGEPRSLVVRIMPWKSGWRGKREFFRASRVKDVTIDYLALPGGGTERRGVVFLDTGASAPGEISTTVIFIKEGGAWLRRAFFSEEVPKVGAPKRPDR